MSKIPDSNHSLAMAIDAALEQKIEKPRSHLGASIIGHPCERYIWLSFRWANRERHPGRILRVFRRGHHEESWVHADLLAAGLTVYTHDEAGKQFGFSDGHFAGSIDGVVVGVPEAPKTPHLLEVKTHSRKSWDDVAKNGVKASKPQHYAQMQVYMHQMDLTRALYYAVNKDDDSIYTERVEYDKSYAQRLTDKAQRLIAEPYMPAPLSNDATWYECRYCSQHEFCHGKIGSKDTHCRACANSTPDRAGVWVCERVEPVAVLDYKKQCQGCDAFVRHPDLEGGG